MQHVKEIGQVHSVRWTGCIGSAWGHASLESWCAALESDLDWTGLSVLPPELVERLKAEDPPPWQQGNPLH